MKNFLYNVYLVVRFILVIIVLYILAAYLVIFVVYFLVNLYEKYFG